MWWLIIRKSDIHSYLKELQGQMSCASDKDKSYLKGKEFVLKRLLAKKSLI